MEFCTKEQYLHFMEQVPRFEKLIQQDNIHFFKFWLDIGREMQIKRFHDRRHDPLKIWKLSAMDIASLSRWDEYTEKRDRMLKETHTKEAPWTVVKANDKRRAHLNTIRHLLLSLDYTGKDHFHHRFDSWGHHLDLVGYLDLNQSPKGAVDHNRPLCYR